MTAVFYRLWAMSLQAGFLILAVLAVRFFLRQYPRSYSYCLWMLAGVRLLCPLWVESPLSLQPDLSGYSASLGETGAQSAEGALPMLSGEAGEYLSAFPEGEAGAEGMQSEFPEGEAGENLSAFPEGEAGVEEMQSEFPEGEAGTEGIWAWFSGREAGAEGIWTLFSKGEAGTDCLSLRQRLEMARRFAGESLREGGKFGRVLCILYPIGAVLLMLFYLWQYLTMRRRVSTAVCEEGNVWISSQITSPFVMGVIFPRIYLPCRLIGAEKEHVLRHERTHIRHQDPLIRIIGIVCICLHWWNPLVWLAVHRMSQDMEMFCDETVLRRASLEERKAYARTLLSFAERESGFGAGLAFGESHTEKRVKNIMKKRKQSLLIAVLAVMFAVFCVVALMTVPVGSTISVDSTVSADSTDSTSSIGSTSSMVPTASDGNQEESASSGGLAEESLTEEELTFFMQASLTVPDFAGEEDLDEAFWEEYLFRTYTSDFEREQVIRYSQQYEEDTPYIRVSLEEAGEAIRHLFGKGLSEYGISPETLGTDGGSLFFEEGFFYVSASDSPIFSLSEESVTATDILTEVSFFKSMEDGEPVSQVVLHILPAEDGQGFQLNGKEETLIPAVPEEQILEGQSFEVEMNPYGEVTFAVYEPDLSQSPYADVTFGLLRDEEEIYAFPLQGTGVLEEGTTFEGMAAVAFPDLNGDGYTDVVTIADYAHTSGPIPSRVRIFTYNEGGYFLEEKYLTEAYNRSHEAKTIEDVEAFASQRENQDYFAHTSIYGRWRVTDYKLPDVYALTQEEIDSLTGARLEYGNAFLWTNVDGETRETTGYEKSMVTMEELEEEFRISGENLGLDAEELVSYQVETQGDSLFGCFFYLADAEHALIYYEGVFFEAVRE
ncbi:MAG: M56 family metallopeptidase [Lachnospiraceae bacterium]|nr:M56 family metallopeptidase [Lachnospiraceae bacterium]